MAEMRGDYNGFHNPVVEYMEQPCHGRCIAEFSGGCHNPTARYVEKLRNESDGLSMSSNNHIFSHNLLPYNSSLLFLIKHEEKILLWCHLIDSIHWKSEVTLEEISTQNGTPKKINKIIVKIIK